MEASALQAPVGLTRQRSCIGTAILRLRSDEQLVNLLRAGHEEAFGVIHERYRQRLLAYMRQMLRSTPDAEDALQDVFERAYSGLLRSTPDRELALRPWLYRIAHNRCIDQLRRPIPPPPEQMLHLSLPIGDPVLEADRRETLRRLLTDVARLPEQQRSALLMRELGGIPYADVAAALGVTVAAVKSLLVRARVSLVQAGEARDTACDDIRAELVLAHEGRVRPSAMARRHMRDCSGCREFRVHLRGVRRQLLALAPATGPLGLLARLLGGSGSGGGAAAVWGGSAASGAAGTGGILASAGALAGGVGHVATLVAATVVTAGGAAELQHTIAAPAHHARPVAAAPAGHGRQTFLSVRALANIPPAALAAARTVALDGSQAPVAAPPAAVVGSATHRLGRHYTSVLDPSEMLTPAPSDTTTAPRGAAQAPPASTSTPPAGSPAPPAPAPGAASASATATAAGSGQSTSDPGQTPPSASGAQSGPGQSGSAGSASPSASATASSSGPAPAADAATSHTAAGGSTGAST